jgi:hypothetical protein
MVGFEGMAETERCSIVREAGHESARVMETMVVLLIKLSCCCDGVEKGERK